MSTFSEESRLLIAKWEAVTDILEATRRLGVELIGVVRGLEPQLARSDWWRNDWGMSYQTSPKGPRSRRRDGVSLVAI